ncbi:RNA-directed DNA polymerase (reverse transcriptase)-related family protein [Rhynchospora pubera]|uniref:RNA-directed DNA polymerase (Reverse transcriptase)-related family protein n=1 Tax=Rhynchospora pubera TaxID=906938 RepID=A0AAV8GMC0_9POAL|nr:RNA-directed DNA polymerase (reverse transcriptase)-related family protein [Rhynchospora pubera]
MKNLVIQTFGGVEALPSETYLGLPIEPRKLLSGDNLLAKLSTALAGWKMTALSQAGRLVLAKAVLMSIPVYQMSTQLFNKNVLSKITALIRNFFWGKTDSKYLSLCAWKRITKPFSMGGLGIRDFRDFNKALIYKLAWKMQTVPDKLWCRVFKAKYFPRRNFWHAKHYGPASHTWGAICKVKSDFANSVQWLIGDGENCAALGTPWVEGWQSNNPTTRAEQNLKVAHFWNRQNAVWDIQQLMATFNLQTVLQILSDPSKQPSALGHPDRLIWTPSYNGLFTVKSAYKTVQLSRRQTYQPQQLPLHFFWKSKELMPRIKLFLWKLCSNVLPTAHRLSTRIPSLSQSCPRCQATTETDYHIFFSCPISRAVWFSSSLGIRSDLIQQTVPEFLEHCFLTLPRSSFIQVSTTLWAIWEQRNQWVFSKKVSSPQAILKRVQIVASPSSINVPEGDPSCTPVNQHPPQLDIGITIVTDGAWNLSGGGWGFLIFKDGILLEYNCGAINNSPSPMHAEAVAILSALQSLKNILPLAIINSYHVTILSDCRNLIKAINNHNNERQELLDWRAKRKFFSILQEKGDITDISFSYISREHNLEAHILAARGRDFVERIRGFQFPTFKPP